MRHLTPTLTPSRVRWLRTLAAGPSRRPHGRTGFDCYHLGWTDWSHDPPSPHEFLTDEGRRVLAEYDATTKGPTMTYDDLMNAVQQFFGDRSRPASETKADLNAVADHCRMLAESIDAGDEDFGSGE